MDMLDVQQIFGRAGRPQYDTSGHGIIITSMANMANYMGLMTSQVPIESQFLTCVPDNLNAEVPTNITLVYVIVITQRFRLY